METVTRKYGKDVGIYENIEWVLITFNFTYILVVNT